MTLSPEEQARLERLIGTACRELPPLEAPQSLAARVTVELQRRAAQPAWRAPFRQWSAGLRIAFVPVALLVMGATLSISAGPGAQRLTTLMLAPLSRALARLESTGALLALVATLCRDLGMALLLDIPTVWLYAGVAGLVALYALLAGISATAYRTLYGTR
jgi:hypothetical protein